MSQVIEIHRKKTFSLQEARELLPVIRRVTEQAFNDIQNLRVQLNYVQEESRKSGLEQALRTRFEEWYHKVRKLGCESKGVWLVDFDNGDGYYCWQYPEPSLEHFHGYDEGFQGRVKIQ